MFRRTSYFIINQPSPQYVYVKKRRRYSFWKFLFDAFMTVITHGWWLVWIFIREIFIK